MGIYKSKIEMLSHRLKEDMCEDKLTGTRDYDYERYNTSIYSARYTKYLLSLGARYNTLACPEEGITQEMVDKIDRDLYDYDSTYKGVHERSPGYDRDIIDYYGLTSDHLKYIKHNIQNVNLESILNSPRLTKDEVIEISKCIASNHPIQYLIHSIISDTRCNMVEYIPKDLVYYPYYWKKFLYGKIDPHMELNKLFLRIDDAYYYIKSTRC